MEIAILVLVVFSLLGSIMWVMPTQRQKFQAKLRLQARAEGFGVQLGRITAPRAQGEMEETSYTIPAYHLFREGLSQQAKHEFVSWKVFRVNAMANEGLPSGWSWKEGERLLSAAQLNVLSKVLQQLPDDVLALESNPIQVIAFWRESKEEDLIKIKQLLKELIKEKM